jgi:hypothetical protein
LQVKAFGQYRKTQYFFLKNWGASIVLYYYVAFVPAITGFAALRPIFFEDRKKMGGSFLAPYMSGSPAPVSSLFSFTIGSA